MWLLVSGGSKSQVLPFSRGQDLRAAPRGEEEEGGGAEEAGVWLLPPEGSALQNRECPLP